MGNECCTTRMLPRKDYMDFLDGVMLKNAILSGNAKDVESVVSLTTDCQVLNSIMDENKNSPFLLVCERFPTDVNLIEYMASRGAQVDMRNFQGETAAHLLAKGGSAKDSALPSIKHLNKHYKLRLETKDINSYDAIWHAVRRSDLFAYKYLKTWGCDRNYVDDRGENLVFDAIRTGSLGLVKQMVEYDGLDIHLTNSKGQTLQDVAAEYSEDILGYLKAVETNRQLITTLSFT
jgi:ankyrin repeat protein